MVTTRSIYRSPEGRERIHRLYDRGVDTLGIEVEEREVETRFGPTHVLETGPDTAPPLLVFHGGNAPNPHNLAWFESLARRWRIVAPDTIGHPGKSADVRISPRGNDYGRWVVDVMDALELDAVPAVGPSYGAAIILRAAVVAPERIERAALLVPAGIVDPSRWRLVRKLVLPTLVYRLAPSHERLRRAIRPLFTGPIPELWLETTRAILDEVRLERTMPPPVTRDELEGFDAPVLVIAAENDLLFPAREVIPRAREAIPGLVAAEVLEGSRHVPDRDTLERVSRRIGEFLEEGR